MNRYRLFGIVAIVLIVRLSVTGCTIPTSTVLPDVAHEVRDGYLWINGENTGVQAPAASLTIVNDAGIQVTNLDLAIGQYYTLHAKDPGGTELTNVLWDSDNPGIVSVHRTASRFAVATGSSARITVADRDAAGRTAVITATSLEGGSTLVETSVTVYVPYPSVKEVVPFWEALPVPASAEGENPGISYFAGKIQEPVLEFNAVRIDLSDPNLRIFVAGGIDDTLSMKVSTFVKENNLLLGINATPFAPVSGREMEPRTNNGLVVSDGIMVSPPYRGYDALIFFDDGSVAVKSQSEITSVENITNAIGGFRRILEGGKISARVIGSTGRHPRSAAGISMAGSCLYLIVIDGRTANSVGATEEETAILLRVFGASEGINFDGGGSSSLAIRSPDGTVRVVNTPIHDGVPGRERAVAGSLGVMLVRE